MRTTLTLEDNIAKQLRHLQKLQGKSFKTVINEALQVGVDALLKPTPNKTNRPYKIRSVHGGPRIDNFDNVWDVIATLEGDNAK